MAEERRVEHNDHDLLVRLDEKVENLTKTVTSLVDGTAKRIQDLETGKVDQKAFDLLQQRVNLDIEKRVRDIEKDNETNHIAMVVLSGLGILILGMLIWHITGYKM
jgi:hypothetical protein